MNFQPLGQRVLIERLEEPTTTASGIIIPDNAKEKPLSGVVRAISKEVADEGQVSVDDKVVFAKYSGSEIAIEGKEYLVLSLDDVLGVIK